MNLHILFPEFPKLGMASVRLSLSVLSRCHTQRSAASNYQLTITAEIHNLTDTTS
jgi:hypothetical protein